MAEADNWDLLDIVEGRRLGYREEAVLIAQEELRSRGVAFEAVDPKALVAVTELRFEVSYKITRLLGRQRTSRYLVVLGAALALAALAGVDVIPGRLTGLIGLVLICAGIFLHVRTREQVASLGALADVFEVAARSARARTIGFCISFAIYIVIFLIFAYIYDALDVPFPF